MDLACSDCSARGMASDWLLSLLLGTAVYGSVRTVVWKDGMGSNPMPPIRFRGVQNEKGRFRRKPAFSFPLFRSGALLPLTQAPLTGAASDRKDDEPLRVGPSIGVNYTQVLATCRAKFTNCRQFKTRDAKSLGFLRMVREKPVCCRRKSFVDHSGEGSRRLPLFCVAEAARACGSWRPVQ